MPSPPLTELLRKQFPTVKFDAQATGLGLGAFPEWDSLAHFNLLLLVEETYGIRFSMDEMAELKSLDEIARSLTAKGVA